MWEDRFLTCTPSQSEQRGTQVSMRHRRNSSKQSGPRGGAQQESGDRQAPNQMVR
jgi:hypothetical protein